MENGEALSPLYERDEQSFISKSVDKEKSDIAGKSFVEFFKDAKPPNENVDILEQLENHENTIAESDKVAKQSADKIAATNKSPSPVPSTKDREENGLEKDRLDIINNLAEAHATTSEKKEADNVKEIGNIDTDAKTVVKTVDEIQNEKQLSGDKPSEKESSNKTSALKESFDSGGNHDESDPPCHSPKVEATEQTNTENELNRGHEHTSTGVVLGANPAQARDSQLNPDTEQLPGYDRSKSQSKPASELQKELSNTYENSTADQKMNGVSKQNAVSDKTIMEDNSIERISKKKQNLALFNDSEHVKPTRSGVSPPLINITKPDDDIASPYSNKNVSVTHTNENADETADRSKDIQPDHEHDNRKGYSDDKASASGTSKLNTGLMVSMQDINTKTDIAEDKLKINETIEEEKSTHQKHVPHSAPKIIITLPSHHSEQEVKEISETIPNESEHSIRNTKEENEAGDKHKFTQSVESHHLLDATKLEDAPYSKTKDIFEHERENYPSEKRHTINEHKDNASANKPHVLKSDVLTKEVIGVHNRKAKETVVHKQIAEPDNSSSYNQLPFNAQETTHRVSSQENVHSNEVLSDAHGNNVIKTKEDNEIHDHVSLTNPDNTVPVIRITKPQDEISSKEYVASTHEFPSQNEIKEDVKVKEYGDRGKSKIDEGEDLAVVSKFENSHSIYFTGRLPTLDHSLNTSPTEENNIGKESEIDQRDISPQETGKFTNDDNKHGVELNHKDSQPESGTNETTQGTQDERLSTPSRKIKQLIQEMNVPAQAYGLSKEKPLTPREISNGGKEDTAESLQTDTAVTPETKDEIDVEGKHVTVSDLNIVASGVLLQDYQKSSATKYDDLPHMKKILAYNAESESQKQNKEAYEHSNEKTTDTKFTRTVTDMSDKSCLHTENTRLDETTSTSYEIEQTAIANRQEIEPEHGIYKQKTSHSETDLKEMIASAKRAIGDDSSTTGAASAATTGACRTDDGLICSNCLCQDSDFVNSGFCHECQEYLCGKCRKLHKKASASMYHHIMESYCTNELKIRKYIRATGYCKDCGVFLCGKCTVQHTGYRAFRRHKIIQSSFISRQAKTKSSTESTSSLNNTKEYESTDEEQLMEDKKKERESKMKRKLYLHNLENNNHYGFKFAKVAETLYPGPDKKLGKSYTSNPHWPYSSIPTLPYLVKPGNLEERALKTPYLKSYKNPFYMQTRKAFDPNIIKMKALQSRYQPEPARQNFRRKEEGLFTARPLRNPVGASLPDIASTRSYNMGGSYSHFDRSPGTKSEKKKPTQQSNKLKTAVYCRDQCLSIPFPSNESPCVINGMEVLFDGRLVVLDKENNNVKLFSRKFVCKASLQFQNRLVDICTSNIYPTDIYVATPRDLYEVSVQRGMEIVRKMKVEIKRIEGLVCWKYGLAVVSMKSFISWEVRLLDYRGNLKSKLEVLNPFTCEIEKRNRYHSVPTKGGKQITIADTKNACCICVDVTTRCIVSETSMSDSKKPTYLTSDHQNNVYVWCEDEVQQVSVKGRNLGVVVKPSGERERHAGCIAYNPSSDRLYVQINSDTIAIYKMNV